MKILSVIDLKGGFKKIAFDKYSIGMVVHEIEKRLSELTVFKERIYIEAFAVDGLGKQKSNFIEYQREDYSEDIWQEIVEFCDKL